MSKLNETVFKVIKTKTVQRVYINLLDRLLQFVMKLLPACQLLGLKVVTSHFLMCDRART